MPWKNKEYDKDRLKHLVKEYLLDVENNEATIFELNRYLLDKEDAQYFQVMKVVRTMVANGDLKMNLDNDICLYKLI